MNPFDKDKLQEYRRKHFAVEVKPERDSYYEPGTVELSVTTNGNQWSTITLTPSERLQVIRALQLFDEAAERGELPGQEEG